MLTAKRRPRTAPVAAIMALVMGYTFSPVVASAMESLAQPGNTWNGIWRGNDGGIYYMQEDAGGLMWLGLSGDGGRSWSTVFNGIVGGPGRTGAVGPWVDVSVGFERGQGELSITRKDANLIVADSSSGGFAAREWRRLGIDPLGDIDYAGLPSQPGAGLTGLWMGNDGGKYYVREHKGYAGLRQISWAGFSGDNGKRWTNVFVGTIDFDGKSIAGPWKDVPRGSNRAGGFLRLQLKDSGTLVATEGGGVAGLQWVKARGIGRPMSMSQQGRELFDLINDARTHPERYPPHGDSQGAFMNPCRSPFEYADRLTVIAGEHNRFLASQPIDWVNTPPNMHLGPNGVNVNAEGEPMHRAGYLARRAENVATGFTTPADAIRFWMQDDAPHNWGHRNLILDCGVRQAGVDHLQGGPGNHYWTLDAGTK